MLGCQPTPSLQFASGGGASWEQYRGRWVVVNYWAEWCKPCLKELPELNELSEHPEVEVLGVNFDALESAELKAAIEKFNIHFPVLTSAPTDVMQHAMPSVLPTTYVYDPDGVLQHTLIGPQTQAGLLAITANR